MRTRPTTITLAILLASCAPLEEVPEQPPPTPETEGASQALNGVPTSEVTGLPANPCPPTGGNGSIDILNRIRKASTPLLSCVGQWQTMENAASAHAWYIARNFGTGCLTTIDGEVSGCTGFSGATLRDRWNAAGVESVFKPLPEVPYSFTVTPCGSPGGGSDVEMFSSWLNNPYYRPRLLHGSILKAGYARNSVATGIFPACSTRYAHVLDIGDGELGGSNPGHNGPVAVWPPPGAQNVLTYQEPGVVEAAPDPNGGGIGYAMTMVDETESQLWWEIRRMVGESGESYDQEWHTSAGGCGANGCVQVISHSTDPTLYPPTDVSFYTPDPLTAGRRYKARVFVCHNVTGGCRWHEWEFKTKP
jgi:hypothetical protein